MLSARAAERQHQVLKTALLIVAQAGVHQRHDAGQILVHALLLVQIFDHGRISSRLCLEPLFPARIGQTASIEDESSSISGLILGQPAMKREAEDSHHKIVGVGSQAQQFLGAEHVVKSVQQCRHGDRQRDIVQQPADVLQRERNALEEVHFALIEPPKSISAQRLHDADVNVGIVMLQERFAREINVAAENIEVMIEQLLSQFRWKIGLGVIQKRSDVVLERALASALIIQKVRLAVSEHNVARLEIAVEEEIARCREQEFREPAEVIFQRLFAEGNACEPQKIIFEVI